MLADREQARCMLLNVANGFCYNQINQAPCCAAVQNNRTQPGPAWGSSPSRLQRDLTFSHDVQPASLHLWSFGSLFSSASLGRVPWLPRPLLGFKVWQQWS